MRHPSTSAPLQFLVAAAAADSFATMSYRPRYRGGRNHGSRGFSTDRTQDAGRAHYVSGDSHLQSVRDSNLGFRQGGMGGYGSSTDSEAPHLYPRPRNHQFRQPQPYFQRPQFSPARPYAQNQYQPPQQQQHQFQWRPYKAADHRIWESAKSRPPPNCERFKVLSYNILADYLALSHRSKLYFHIPRYVLDWNWRKGKITSELGWWSADIMCFQEVDKFENLEEELKVRGYTGIWKMRTGTPADGCAMFWRTSRFKLLHEESIEFNRLGLRDNVAQICVLEFVRHNKSDNVNASLASSVSSQKVVICNIHVLYNPKRGDIKLGQVRVLLDKAHSVSKLWNDAPVVLCGDFNCTPKSAIYNFIAEQKLDISGLDRDKVSGQSTAANLELRPNNPNPGVPPTNDVIRAPLMVDPREVEAKRPNNLESIEEVDLAEKGNIEKVDDASNSNNGSSGGHFNKHVEFIREIKINDSFNDSGINGLGMDSEQGDSLNGGATSFVLSCQSSLPAAVEASDSADLLVHEELENLSVNDQTEATMEGEHTAEDDYTFLSALQESGDPKEYDLVSQTSPVGTLGREVDDGSSRGSEPEPFEVETAGYDPSFWTPAEIETATGNKESTLLEHPLNLTSTYAEVEDISRSRDLNGEPLFTSYHRCFFGTVDYIWHSEGLQTVSVLAPIPKDAVKWTPGFPTRKWGSDHIALVSEFALIEKTNEGS